MQFKYVFLPNSYLFSVVPKCFFIISSSFEFSNLESVRTLIVTHNLLSFDTSDV